MMLQTKVPGTVRWVRAAWGGKKLFQCEKKKGSRKNGGNKSKAPGRAEAKKPGISRVAQTTEGVTGARRLKPRGKERKKSCGRPLPTEGGGGCLELEKITKKTRKPT